MAQGTDARIITTMGGNLFEVAASQLGSALQWINIARTNKLIDPMLSGQSHLIIPLSSPIFSDGIGPQ
ncbi:MAG TPA: hypothetical protein VGC14_19245 [Rhizobium sp.]